VLRLGVTREMHLHAFGQETFAAALPPPGQSRAATFRAHARAETMLLFPSPLRSL